MRPIVCRRFLHALSLVCLLATTVRADEPQFKQQEDVIYGRKYGTALTLDVFNPSKTPTD